jgi:hypothetical protein
LDTIDQWLTHYTEVLDVRVWFFHTS